jgi:hypothetical protein
MKKIIGIITAFSIFASLSSGCVNAEGKDITVIYDGQTVSFDVQPEIINDRVMVPMRTIFEIFGAKVKWDSETQTITAKRKSKTIKMTIGSLNMTKNDETYTFDTAPVIEDGRTLVPIRAIGDLLELDVSWDDTKNTVTITTPADDEDESWKENTGTIDLDKMQCTGEGISIDENIITISDGGDFEVTGTLDDGQIIIDTEEKAKLRLSGMSLTNSGGSAIYVKNADKAYITLTENTENYLSDGEERVNEDEKACITSEDNLEIKGNGSLTVNGNYNHGIDGSDSIEINNGNITITAKNDGIHANDTLLISGGTLNVTASGDGIQADEIVDITGGTVNIVTNGEVAVSEQMNFGGFGSEPMTPPEEMTQEERQAMMEEREQQIELMQNAEEEQDNSEDVTSKGIKADWMLDISGGDITVNSTDHAIHCASDINISGGNITLNSEYKKGISSHENVTIDDGNITITKATEGIESKEIMTINGGNLDITASDDGLNAGGNGVNDFGKNMPQGGRGGMPQGGMNPKNTEENMTPPDMNNNESRPEPSDMPTNNDSTNTQTADRPEPPQMPDGNTQTDNTLQDIPNRGQNPRGGGFGGNNTDEISTEHHIQISGGTIYINAQGDGIDSNGSLVIDGGEITIDGPTSGGDSTFDTSGAFMVNGSALIGIGSLGMIEVPNSYSSQNVLSITLSETEEEGSKIEIKNSDGETIISHEPAKEFQSVICSSSEFKTGEEYSIYINGELKESVTVTDVITSAGTAQGFGGGFGGGRGGRAQNTDAS